MTRPDLADPLAAALLLGEWVDYTTGYRAGIRRDDLIERTRSFLLDYPAPEGYVLVSADMLEKALRMWEAPTDSEDVGSYLSADISANGAHVVAAAILAALKGPAR